VCVCVCQSACGLVVLIYLIFLGFLFGDNVQSKPCLPIRVCHPYTSPSLPRIVCLLCLLLLLTNHRVLLAINVQHLLIIVGKPYVMAVVLVCIGLQPTDECLTLSNHQTGSRDPYAIDEDQDDEQYEQRLDSGSHHFSERDFEEDDDDDDDEQQFYQQREVVHGGDDEAFHRNGFDSGGDDDDDGGVDGDDNDNMAINARDASHPLHDDLLLADEHSSKSLREVVSALEQR
jgi:hypothetical protein